MRSIGLERARIQEAQPARTQISYDAFLALDDKQRRERFDVYDPDTKSILMRTHARRWLEKNCQRLSASQVQLVQDLIAYMSPEAYRNPSDVLAAIGPHRSPPAANWLNDVWLCFTECVIG